MKDRLNRNFWHKHGHAVIIYALLVAPMVSVNIFNKDFFTLGDLKNLPCSFFLLLMTALGQTLVILTGGIDLSLEGVATLRNVICVTPINPDSAWGFILALGAAAAVGLTCGAVNDVLVTRGRLAPIIVTTVTTAVLDGMVLLFMPNLGGSVYRVFAKLLTRGYSSAVPSLLFTLVLCLVRSPASSTPYGKALRVIGGSEDAACSTDIRVGKIKLCAHCLAGLLYAVVGIFLSVQMNSADATIGKNYAMNAITATIVGGAAMIGTMGDSLGAVAGVFIIPIISNMLNPFNAPPFYQFMCQSLILIIALSLSALHKRH